MTSIPFTQIPSATTDVAPIDFVYINGDWPIPGFGHATQVSTQKLDQIKNEGTGSAISSHMSYLSLGHFFIHTDLLEAHSTQRQIKQHHVQQLRDDFLKKGIHRLENAGVVIGLGEGWHQMKKHTPKHVFVSNSSPHLHRLSTTAGGPIAQIIRGGHRTAAAKLLSNSPDHTGNDYWYYNVLIPSKFPYTL